MEQFECGGGNDKEDANQLGFRQPGKDFRVAREKLDQETAEAGPEKIERKLRALPGAAIDLGPPSSPQYRKQNKGITDLV